tara:strand:- start:483 stop:872 length:390 start_codon:yes stop_codon:yes gene_type:complete
VDRPRGTESGLQGSGRPFRSLAPNFERYDFGGFRQGIVHVEESAGDDGVVFHATGEARSHFRKGVIVESREGGEWGVGNETLLFFFTPPWQGRQLAWRMGRTSREKSILSGAAKTTDGRARMARSTTHE